MATNGSFSQQDQLKDTAEQFPATSGPADTTSGGASNSDLSKDEVGWYFVEQYYNTLSKSPEKLHLFYTKKSQFVSGLEAEVTNVSVGRSAIQERIKELDFQDCKVRVSNVDSQASFDNIVIQVIGETSNKSAEPKKFVQTFVLAKQPSGYFVLNDIFRYINEEVEENQVEGGVPEESALAEPLVEDVELPKPQASIEEPVTTLDTEVIDQKLDEVVEAEPVADAPPTNGTSAEVDEPEVEQPKEEEAPTPEVAEKEVEEEVKEPEKPVDPVPSPVQTTKAPPAQPSAPPKPLSWANRAAAAVGGSALKPAVPNILPKTSTPPAQTRAPPPAVTKPTPPPTSTTPVVEKNKENSAPGTEWQTAGGDHSKRQNRPQSISGQPEEKGTMGYVRNVTEKVDGEELKKALASHGQIVYFDVNRGKNCAFVEFATAEGYQAAASANPHNVNGEQIYVEPRRPKAGAYGGNNYAGGRGGINGRGRGGFEQSRTGGQGGRGNFGANRGRGGANGGPARGGRLNQTANA